MASLPRTSSRSKYWRLSSNVALSSPSRPPFVSEEGETWRDSQVIVRDDFWTATSNRQLNFVQHVRAILELSRRATVVVPDYVLFEGGAGEAVRRSLLHECDVHMLLRLPTGNFYAQGVKDNVLFFGRRPTSEAVSTQTLWICDFRTNQNFTLKQNPLTREALDEFVAYYRPANRHERAASWPPYNPAGRWPPTATTNSWRAISSRSTSSGRATRASKTPPSCQARRARAGDH